MNIIPHKNDGLTLTVNNISIKDINWFRYSMSNFFFFLNIYRMSHTDEL